MARVTSLAKFPGADPNIAELRGELKRLRAEGARLRAEAARLRAENERLRGENRDLRLMLDTHVARAGSAPLFGPLELTAGTCVGPRRRTK